MRKRIRKPIKRSGQFFVYIVECQNGYFYTGYTSNLTNRIKAHNNSQGAKYLKGKGPVKLVYAKEYRYYMIALKEERRIKTLTRKQKEALIATNNNEFKDLL